MDLTHQYLANALNRRAEVERENRIMDEITQHAAPLFYAVMACAAAAVLWHITEPYRINAIEKQRENEIISAKLAACTAGQAVLMESGVWITCKIKVMK